MNYEEDEAPEDTPVFTDTERLTWLIKENAYSLIAPGWLAGREAQQAVRARIDKHMHHDLSKK